LHRMFRKVRVEMSGNESGRQTYPTIPIDNDASDEYKK
jgi:hypothetical protein